MRILFFLQCLGVGGVERQVFLLADHLVRRGHDVSIAALHVLDPRWRWFEGPASIRVQVFFPSTPRHVLSAASQLAGATLRLRSLLKREGVQLVYGTQRAISESIAWLATRGMPNTRLVWCSRGRGGSSAVPYRRANWKMAGLSRVCTWVSASVPLMISISEASRDYLQARGYRCPKTIVIHNGIDTDRFRPDADARVRVRTDWAILENETLIGLVGRLDPVKGHPVFLEAAATLARERTDVRFVCVGDGPEPYRGQLQRLGQSLGLTDQLIWAGSRQDMPAVYSALDIVCSTSYREGFNNVLGEAMACGVPCVVTDSSDPAKIVGNTGIVVPPGDPQALVEGLVTMMQELLKDQPRLLRERIAQNFSVETIVDATEKALLEVYHGAAPGS